jgi:DNA-binding transcriptional MerR regulator
MRSTGDDLAGSNDENALEVTVSYTITELARLAGVSTRTLRYYDEIGLLPAQRTDRNNDERVYDTDALMRLQQILFYRELDFRLDDIRALLDDAAYDVLRALHEQKRLIRRRRAHLGTLLDTIERTIAHLQGKAIMSDEQFFEGFDPARYEDEARQRWGADVVDESMRRWRQWSPTDQASVVAEGEDVFKTVLANMADGAAAPHVQATIDRLFQYVNRFWDCDVQAFRGLADLYVSDPRFRATFESMDPGLPEFIHEAVVTYCDRRADAPT